MNDQVVGKVNGRNVGEVYKRIGVVASGVGQGQDIQRMFEKEGVGDVGKAKQGTVVERSEEGVGVAVRDGESVPSSAREGLVYVCVYTYVVFRV